MNKHFFTAAFGLGLAAVGWVAAGFVGNSWTALAMTAAIAGVYLLGANELRHFRAATRGLAQALEGVAQAPSTLDAWLAQVPAGLRNAVRLRVEGERAALPGPALTPYLVGLLVMLGMLGTFLGMVVTFKGAVFALDGSTDLQVIRSALAAPIKGLALSFGSSIAGVAASAMLGLMSAIARRERLDVTRQLEQRIATVLQPFTLAHQRLQTHRALQQQAHALPAVVDKLDALLARIEQRSELLDAQLLQRQDRFQREATQAYAELARSVEASLKDSLAAGGRAAGESILPVVESAMTRIAQEAQRTHAQLGEVAQRQVDVLARQFGATARGVTEQAARAQAEFAQAERQRVQAFTQALQALASDLHAQWQRVGDETLAAQRDAGTILEQTAAAMAETSGAQARRTAEQVEQLLAQSHALLQAREQGEARWTERQERAEQQRLQDEAQRSEHQARLEQQRLHGEAQRLEQQARLEQQRLQAWTESLQALAADLKAQWQGLGEDSLAQHRAAGAALEQAAEAMARTASEQAARTAEQVDRLLAQSQDLVRSRAEAESGWLAQHGERMDALAALWRTELAALRTDESHRGQAAVDRLGELQAAVAQHLATLGAALEAPITRLLQTASEVPQAAAGVITQLREEMSRATERDNVALQERTLLLEQLASLLQGLQAAAGEQRAAIETMVRSASGVLEQAGTQFGAAIATQSAQTADLAGQISGAAGELSQLAASFGHSVQQFQAGNTQLAEALQRVEAALQRSTARSDEQLAYYVAQAREVIDLSIASQQGVIDSLRQLHGRAEKTLADGELA